MEDRAQANFNSPNNGSERSCEPVRSRWTPKPEQILILESIFNSGMVNPPKDETVRIRKLLEKFGSVGDANVFYWFQNRRSRSRRRQRQMQASLDQQRNNNQLVPPQVGGAIQYDQSVSTATDFGVASPSSYYVGLSPSSSSTSSVCGNVVINGGDHHQETDLFQVSVAGQMGFTEIEQNLGVTPTSLCHSSDTSNLHFQYGLIMVFINGVPTEVPKGPIDIKAMFGEDTVLVHSSGVPVPTNEFGYLMQSLQHGESYFLVSKAT